MLAVRDGRDPNMIETRVQWADAATRSVAQEADAVVKLPIRAAASVVRAGETRIFR